MEIEEKSKVSEYSILTSLMREMLSYDIALLDPHERKAKILKFMTIPPKLISNDDIHLLRELVLFESNSILEKKGQIFSVKSGKIDRRKQKLGNCYHNAARKMGDGYEYGYVEGYCITKNEGLKFGHAWNVDKDGNHFDFTFKNSEEYDYFGIVIPIRIVYNVGFRNGGVWFSVLPFIEETELISILQQTTILNGTQ